MRVLLKMGVELLEIIKENRVQTRCLFQGRGVIVKTLIVPAAPVRFSYIPFL